MNGALVVGAGVAGLVVGAVLDPLGQRLAERSKQLEAARRAEAAEASGSGGSVPQATDEPVPAATDEAVPDHAADDVPVVRHLVPAGPCLPRTVAAAVLTGGLFAGLAAHFGAHLELAPYAVFVAVLVTVSITDLSHRLVPRWLIYWGTGLIAALLVASAASDHAWHHLAGAAIGAVAAFAVFFAIWWFVPKGMGYGDVRLAGMIGLATGYLSLLHTYLAFLGGFVVGMVVGVVVLLATGQGRRTRIPFAPALAIGAVLAVFYGSHLAQSLFGAGS